jgi:hypothetical protein
MQNGTGGTKTRALIRPIKRTSITSRPTVQTIITMISSRTLQPLPSAQKTGLIYSLTLEHNTSSKSPNTMTATQSLIYQPTSRNARVLHSFHIAIYCRNYSMPLRSISPVYTGQLITVYRNGLILPMLNTDSHYGRVEMQRIRIRTRSFRTQDLSRSVTILLILFYLRWKLWRRWGPRSCGVILEGRI